MCCLVVFVEFFLFTKRTFLDTYNFVNFLAYIYKPKLIFFLEFLHLKTNYKIYFQTTRLDPSNFTTWGVHAISTPGSFLQQQQKSKNYIMEFFFIYSKVQPMAGYSPNLSPLLAYRLATIIFVYCFLLDR